MKRKACIPVITALLLALLLAGCNGGASSSVSLPPSVSDVVVEEVPVLTELEQNILTYEQLVQTEGTAANYLALAGYYGEAGMVKKQRDALERSCRLNGDAAALEALQGLVVNVAEENSLVQQQAGQLADGLSTPEFQAEAVGLLISPDWMPAMMPKLKEGHRSYYLEVAGGTLYIEVGYGKGGGQAPYTHAWFVTESGQTTVLMAEEGVVQLMATNLAGGQYDGAFSSWLCDAASGMVFHDTGTFAGGVMVGEFVSTVHDGADGADLFALFSSREELDATPYTGDFGEDGVTTLTQPNGLGSGLVAYAFTQNGNYYLSTAVAEGEETEGHVFSAAFFGLEPYPEFARYTPVPETAPQGEVTVDLSQVQVRVYDGNVEWFDGSSWHVMGTVDELAASDPLRVADLPQPEAPAEGEEGEEGGEEVEEAEEPPTGLAGRLAGRDIAQVKKTTSGSGGSSGSSKTPTTPTPSTPAPTQPDPTPAQPDPTPPAQPDPTPPPGSGDGEDIEWSGDKY